MIFRESFSLVYLREGNNLYWVVFSDGAGGQESKCCGTLERVWGLRYPLQRNYGSSPYKFSRPGQPSSAFAQISKLGEGIGEEMPLMNPLCPGPEKEVTIPATAYRTSKNDLQKAAAPS